MRGRRAGATPSWGPGAMVRTSALAALCGMILTIGAAPIAKLCEQLEGLEKLNTSDKAKGILTDLNNEFANTRMALMKGSESLQVVPA